MTHGTRACYVTHRCRCRPCKDANKRNHDEHRAAIRDLEITLEPNDATPPPARFTRTSTTGRVYPVEAKSCPGANGEPCVKPGTWLRGRRVCIACAEHHTVRGGLFRVPAEKARTHILALRKNGIGRGAICAATDISKSSLFEISTGVRKWIAPELEEKLLAVDESVRADHSFVKSGPTMRRIKSLRKRGFTLMQLSALLGAKNGMATPILALYQKRRLCTALTELRVKRLCKRIRSQKIQPHSEYVPSGPIYELLKDLGAMGFGVKTVYRMTGATLGCRQKHERVLRRTAEIITELHRKAKAGEIKPLFIQSSPSWLLIEDLIAKGYTRPQLTKLLDYPVDKYWPKRPATIARGTAENIAIMHADLLAEEPEPPKPDRYKLDELDRVSLDAAIRARERTNESLAREFGITTRTITRRRKALGVGPVFPDLVEQRAAI